MIKLWRYRIVGLLVGFSVAHQNAYSGSNLIDSAQGYYSSPSKRCTKFSESKDDFVSCEKEFRDCLMIKKVDPQTATVEIYSTQANQHVCAVNGTASIIDGKLILYLGTEKRDQYLDVLPQENNILLKQHVPIGQNVENCGAHANFEGLLFKKIAKDTSKYSCFDD